MLEHLPSKHVSLGSSPKRAKTKSHWKERPGSPTFEIPKPPSLSWVLRIEKDLQTKQDHDSKPGLSVEIRVIKHYLE